VCGIDPGLELNQNKKITKSPEMDRRIEVYRRYHQGYGEILVQMNVEDTRLGVAEYVIEKHGLQTIELKWGQGAKCIGGEIKVNSLERALELQKRGYIVTPDPSNPVIQAAYKSGAIKEFERHSRLGFVSEDGFMAEVERLRNLGFKRITLKTGAYSLRELAMAIKWGAAAKIDLLTIDGAPGGTGMSPWRMMEEWGIPSIYLHSAAVEFCDRLAARGERVPDLAFAGGFSSEDGVFKALALGAPYTRAVCMGRALMIPGMVGKNISEWMKKNDLPKTVSQYGTTPEEVFVAYETVKDLMGSEAFKEVPLGAIGIFSYSDKIKVGLQQIMAGARCFNVNAISRRELMSLTEECTKVTGIPYVMDAYRAEAEAILDAPAQAVSSPKMR
jgi:glutamate synthase domain-containing protein 2